jgi:hypothetical protein
MDVMLLHPPFRKGEKLSLPLKKGGWEGFYKDGFKRLNCYKNSNEIRRINQVSASKTPVNTRALDKGKSEG